MLSNTYFAQWYVVVMVAMTVETRCAGTSEDQLIGSGGYVSISYQAS